LIANLLKCRIGARPNHFRQAGPIDLPDHRTPHAARHRLAGFPATLLDPAHPRATDLERVRDLLRLHAAIVRREYPIPEIL